MFSKLKWNGKQWPQIIWSIFFKSIHSATRYLCHISPTTITNSPPLLTHTNLAILFNNTGSNKNLNTYHHISGKVFTSSMCHNSVGWPFQVVDFFCENSKFSLKNFKPPLMVATTSSSIYGRQGCVDRSWSAARWAGRWHSTGQNWRRTTGTTGSNAGQSRWSFFKSRFIVS